MSPGTYLTQKRIKADMSHEDVVAHLGTVPSISTRERIDLLVSIELDGLPMRPSTIQALAAIPQLAIDSHLLATLADEWGQRTDRLSLIRFVPACTSDQAR